MPQEYDIRNVAVYLRKSRAGGSNSGGGEKFKNASGEEYDDFAFHRDDLLTLCTQRGWTFTEYSEIGTGDKIALRPKMIELLQDVEQGMWDAVLVVHSDRLSRGDEVEQAQIKRTFAMSETLLVTKERVYDYNNESDMMMAEFEGLMARMEYKTIARRFRQGKARKSKLGFWANGKPPFPYVYSQETHRAVPDESNVLVWNHMKDLALNGYAVTDIAWQMNKEGIASPRGGLWNPDVVRRLLTDEVHLGKIVVGKKRKLVGADCYVRKPKEEWIVYSNCHEPVISQVEHDKICFLMQRIKSIPKAARAGASDYSGLILCHECKSVMQIQKRPNRPTDCIKSCGHHDAFGERCINLGGAINGLDTVVRQAIEIKEKQLIDAINSGIQLEDIRVMLKLAEEKLAEIKKFEKRLSRLEDALLDGDFTEDRYRIKKAELEADMAKLEEEYQIIMARADSSKFARNEDMLNSVRSVLKVIDNPNVDPKDRNRAYKSIIFSIEWSREELDHPGEVVVNFL